MIFNHTSAPSEVDPPRCDLLKCGKVKDCNECLPVLESTIRKRMGELSPEAIMEDVILKAHRDMFTKEMLRACTLHQCSRYASHYTSMNVMT